MTRAGTTLIEVVVATLLLAIGALAMAGGIAHAERARRTSTSLGLSVAAAVSTLEQWRGRAWNAGPSARTDTVLMGRRRVAVTLRLRPLSACLAEAIVEAGVVPAGGRTARLATLRFREDGPCGP